MRNQLRKFIDDMAVSTQLVEYQNNKNWCKIVQLQIYQQVINHLLSNYMIWVTKLKH